MFKGIPILSIITFIPLFAAGFMMLMSKIVRADGKSQIEKQAPLVAMVASGSVFVLSILLLFDFHAADAGHQFLEEVDWMGGGIKYRMGVDGISILFIVLTTFLTPLCIIASARSIKTRMLEYMVAFLILETLMIWRVLRA